MLLSIYDGNPDEWSLNNRIQGDTPNLATAINEICRINLNAGDPSDSPIGPLAYGIDPRFKDVFWLAAGWSMGRQVWPYFMILSINTLSHEQCEKLFVTNCPEALKAEDDEEDDEDEDGDEPLDPLLRIDA